MRWWLLTVALLAAGLVGSVGGPASAEDPLADHRPCVDHREVNGTLAGYTRARLERKWEVTGLGVDFEVPTQGWMVAYPWCDHPTPGTWDVTLAYVAVAYKDGPKQRYTGKAVEANCQWDAACDDWRMN